MNTAYDLTQAERQDCFGTTDDKAIAAICDTHQIQYTWRRQKALYPMLIVWRCHLPDVFEKRLADKEREGVVYTGGFIKREDAA